MLPYVTGASVGCDCSREIFGYCWRFSNQRDHFAKLNDAGFAELDRFKAEKPLNCVIAALNALCIPRHKRQVH
jgi:hypothetical protein